MTKDTTSKGDTLDDDSDDDSLTRFMTPEVRRRIQNKRKRNQAMLNKLKTQIDHFDSNKKVSEGSNSKKRNKKKRVFQKNETIADVATSNNDLQSKQEDKDVNEDVNQEQKNNTEQEYEIEHICNHMRKRKQSYFLLNGKDMKNQLGSLKM